LDKVLPQDFYTRHTLAVARDLLGKILFVQTKEGKVSGRIVETEAYRADDPASHSARGKTPRASIMFGESGRVYVYFIYGMYEMLNFVTEPEGDAGAVLIRALEPLEGEDLMHQIRSRHLEPRAKPLTTQSLTNGPGKLCRSLGIELKDNGASLQGPRIQVVDDGFQPAQILESPRVGITVGTEAYWRYFIQGNPFVSRAPQNAQARQIREPSRQVNSA
jgi:DNA-3-methyladenine glycosylase